MKAKPQTLLILAASAVFACRPCAAATVNVPDGTTDWTAAGLAASDTARLLADATVYVSDAASMNVVSNLSLLQFYGGDSSTVVITVPEGETWGMGCNARSANSGKAAGNFVKRGKGTLNLLNCIEGGAYNCNITVESGTLRMPTAYSNNKWVYTGVIDVHEDAVFIGPGFANPGGTMNWCSRGFAGKGVITNANAYAVRVGLAVNDGNWIWDGITYDFGGEFRGWFDFAPSRMRQMFSGTNSTFSSFSPRGDDGTYSAGEGTVGVMKFGMTGESSSVNTNSFIKWIGGGGLLYLGTGETTDKQLQFQEGGHPFIDGGLHGGLVFTADLDGRKADSSHAVYDKTVVLMGSNAVPCVIAGIVPSWTQSSVTYTFHIVKKGTGIWRLDNTESTMTGTITAEEGVLGFGKLREKGCASSFGYATGEAAAECSIALGGAETEGGIGFYSCTNGNSRSTTRPISLSGFGRIVNDSTNSLGIGMIGVATEAGATLTLDGSGHDGTVYDLQDGAGVLSVVKTGSGTWRLGGTNSFTGTLEVKEGTLVISNPTNYTYYKWVTRALNSDSATTFWMSELGLYDEDCRSVNGGLTAGSEYYDLAPGQAAVSYADRFSYLNSSLDNLFDHKSAPLKATISPTPVAGDESTRIEIMMRMPGNAKKVVSWDFAGGDRGSGNANADYYVSSCQLMGSVDGVHFDVLDEIDDARYSETYRAWSATGAAVNSANCETHEGGYKLDRTSPDAFPGPADALVSVSAGATLRSEGFAAEISRLKISAAGAGTVDGIAFARNGEIHLTDMPSTKSVTLPGSYVNAEGLSNIGNWPVYVNGSTVPANGRVSVSLSGDKLRYVSSGMVITFR